MDKDQEVSEIISGLLVGKIRSMILENSIGGVRRVAAEFSGMHLAACSSPAINRDHLDLIHRQFVKIKDARIDKISRHRNYVLDQMDRLIFEMESATVFTDQWLAERAISHLLSLSKRSGLSSDYFLDEQCHRFGVAREFCKRKGLKYVHVPVGRSNTA